MRKSAPDTVTNRVPGERAARSGGGHLGSDSINYCSGRAIAGIRIDSFLSRVEGTARNVSHRMPPDVASALTVLTTPVLDTRRQIQSGDKHRGDSALHKRYAL